MAIRAGQATHRPEWLLPVTVACGVLGAMIAMRVQSQQEMGELGKYRRPDQLASLLAAAQHQTEQQGKEIAGLRSQVTQFQSAAAEHRSTEALLNEELQRLKMALGLTEVEGPGIRLTLDDSPLRKTAQENVDTFLWHDYDLLRIVNELWSAGAEAISINEQRIGQGSAIRCVGSVININDVPVASPFEVLAIGDPKALSAPLTIAGGVLETPRALKFEIKLREEKMLRIPALAVTPKFRHGRAAPTKVEE